MTMTPKRLLPCVALSMEALLFALMVSKKIAISTIFQKVCKSQLPMVTPHSLSLRSDSTTSFSSFHLKNYQITRTIVAVL